MRQEWQQGDRNPEIDMDMIHILSAINYLNKEAYERSKRSVNRLIEEIRIDKNKIITDKTRQAMPVFIKMITNPNETGM